METRGGDNRPERRSLNSRPLVFFDLTKGVIRDANGEDIGRSIIAPQAYQKKPDGRSSLLWPVPAPVGKSLTAKLGQAILRRQIHMWIWDANGENQRRGWSCGDDDRTLVCMCS